MEKPYCFFGPRSPISDSTLPVDVSLQTQGCKVEATCLSELDLYRLDQPRQPTHKHFTQQRLKWKKEKNLLNSITPFQPYRMTQGVYQCMYFYDTPKEEKNHGEAMKHYIIIYREVIESKL